MEGELPRELDYFKYAAGGSAKRKADGDGVAAKALKKRKVEDEDQGDSDDDEDDDEDADATEETPSKLRQRVVTKGSNVPAHVEKFSALAERYQMSSLLLSNLTLHGYHDPTGIQSYGIPILLEV